MARALVLCLAALAFLELALRALVPPSALHFAFDRGMNIIREDKERDHPWTAGVTNPCVVAVIGDSITVGSGNQRYSRLGSVLEWMMNTRNDTPPVRVDVFARPTATYQQAEFVDDALGRGAKVVVLVCSPNDAEDWENGAELMARRPDLHEWHPPAWLAPLYEHTALGRLIAMRMDRDRRYRGFLAYCNYLYAPGYPGLKKFHDAIAAYRAKCDAHGARIVGIMFPLLNQDLRPGHYDAFLPAHRTVAGFFREAGVPFLDLYPTLSRCDPDRLQNIPLLDAHPNEVCHRIAAEQLFFFMIENGIIPRDYYPRQFTDAHLIETWKKKLRDVGQEP